MQTLSIVIANYNYADYVGASIQSALDVVWNDVDVVVVDDGSTDNSREIIKQFAGSVTAVYTENRGQREAVNTGFSTCRGDVIIFLDADDTLPANVANELSRYWLPSVSKWQFTLQPVNADGHAFGHATPNLDPVPTSAQMRRWLISTSAYPTPPGSGNAYARHFLERVLPVDASAGSAADSALLVTAPLAGDVVVIPSVKVNYRRHAMNDSNLLTDPATSFQREVTRAEQRWLFATHFAVRLDPPQHLDPRALRRSRELLQFRCVAWRMAQINGAARTERLVQLVFDVARSLWPAGPESWFKRLLILIFSASVLVAPRLLLPRLLTWRFTSR